VADLTVSVVEQPAGGDGLLQSAADSAPRRLASLQYRLASLQGPSEPSTWSRCRGSSSWSWS